MITRRLIPVTVTRLSAMILLILGVSLLGGLGTPRAWAAPPVPVGQGSAPAAAPAAPADTPDFQDVPVSAPYYSFLHGIYAQGIVSGYTCGSTPSEPCVPPGNLPYYRPGNSVSRSQMSKFVNLARTQPGAAFEGGTTGILPLLAHTTSGTAFVGISNNGNGVYAFSNTGGGALWGEGGHSYGLYAASVYSDALHVVGSANIIGSANISGDSGFGGKLYIAGFTIINEAGTSNENGLLVVGNTTVDGNFHATGSCCGVQSLTTQIDDPRDPAHTTLNQAAVVASEQLAVYSGNVTTDATGSATVTLPAYVPATAGDFRYQLTVIGQFAQAIVAQEVSDNHFAIQTDKPQVKVSWQVTGVRHDAAATQHPLVVEQAKAAGK